MDSSETRCYKNLSESNQPCGSHLFKEGGKELRTNEIFSGRMCVYHCPKYIFSLSFHIFCPPFSCGHLCSHGNLIYGEEVDLHLNESDNSPLLNFSISTSLDPGPTDIFAPASSSMSILVEATPSDSAP